VIWEAGAAEVSEAGKQSLHGLDLSGLAVFDTLCELDGVRILSVVDLLLDHRNGALMVLDHAAKEETLTLVGVGCTVEPESLEQLVTRIIRPSSAAATQPPSL
jgi:hypothetical protein